MRERETTEREKPVAERERERSMEKTQQDTISHRKWANCLSAAHLCACDLADLLNQSLTLFLSVSPVLSSSTGIGFGRQTMSGMVEMFGRLWVFIHEEKHSGD